MSEKKCVAVNFISQWQNLIAEVCGSNREQTNNSYTTVQRCRLALHENICIVSAQQPPTYQLMNLFKNLNVHVRSKKH